MLAHLKRQSFSLVTILLWWRIYKHILDRKHGRTDGRTDGPPNGPDSPPNGPNGPPNGSGRRSWRPSAPAVQPNQTKNNDTPTIASLGYTGPSYWGRIYNSRRFCQRKCNSHDIEIYWILYKCEKSISRSKENRNQQELLSFFPDKDREKYAILESYGEKY